MVHLLRRCHQQRTAMLAVRFTDNSAWRLSKVHWEAGDNSGL